MTPAKMVASSGGGFYMRRRLLLFLVASMMLFVMAVTWRLVVEAPAQSASVERMPGSDPVLSLHERIRRRPEDANNYAALGMALLQQVREGHDTSLYTKAGEAFDAALERDPQHVDALVGRGMLALAVHAFADALALGEQVTSLNPYKAAGYGIRVDALVEMGRYAEAVSMLQQMVDLRPDLESYSRISYLRELHGDNKGALAAMQMAAHTAVPGTEPWLWTTTQLGNLAWSQGALDEAEGFYRAVLRWRADAPYAQFGLARLAAARGRHEQALAILRPLAKRLPLPEFLVALGELYAGQGQWRRAREQFALVRVIQQLNGDAGMDVDLELATFEVLHGEDVNVAVAAARAAYRARPTIYAADALAWALHRAGDHEQAWHYSQEALRLGTEDAVLHSHAAEIAESLGDQAAAKKYRSAADKINPYYSPWH